MGAWYQADTVPGRTSGRLVGPGVGAMISTAGTDCAFATSRSLLRARTRWTMPPTRNAATTAGNAAINTVRCFMRALLLLSTDNPAPIAFFGATERTRRGRT